MKLLKRKMLAAAALLTVFVLSGCAGNQHMGMDEKTNECMGAGMMHEKDMQKEGSKMQNSMKGGAKAPMPCDMKKMH